LRYLADQLFRGVLSQRVGQLTFYEREVPVKPTIDYLNAMEEKTIAEQVESLANVQLRLQRDIASLEELTTQLERENGGLSQHIIHRTQRGVRILVSRGVKSQYDFKVQYQEIGKRVRTPKHIHLIIDLYMKLTGNRQLTLQLVEHIINNVILKVQPATSYPPALQIFSSGVVSQFQQLDNYGEYSVEFLLVITELIMIQEKTNYPRGVMNLNLFKSFKRGDDIFSVVSAATFRGR